MLARASPQGPTGPGEQERESERESERRPRPERVEQEWAPVVPLSEVHWPEPQQHRTVPWLARGGMQPVAGPHAIC